MKTLLSLLLLSLILSSCASSAVLTKTTKNVDFTQYRTYKIMPYVNEADASKNIIRITDENQKRIEDALMESLSIRGLDTAVQSDIILLYAVDIDMQKSYSIARNYDPRIHSGGTYSTYYGYSGGYYGGYGYNGVAAPYASVVEHDYEMGRIRLGMIEMSSGELLWLGSTSEKLKDNSQKTDQQIKRIIRRIMMEFPIPYVKE